MAGVPQRLRRRQSPDSIIPSPASSPRPLRARNHLSHPPAMLGTTVMVSPGRHHRRLAVQVPDVVLVHVHVHVLAQCALLRSEMPQETRVSTDQLGPAPRPRSRPAPRRRPRRPSGTSAPRDPDGPDPRWILHGLSVHGPNVPLRHVPVSPVRPPSRKQAGHQLRVPGRRPRLRANELPGPGRSRPPPPDPAANRPEPPPRPRSRTTTRLHRRRPDRRPPGRCRGPGRTGPGRPGPRARPRSGGPARPKPPPTYAASARP
jgi:hypothetical protein